MTATKEAQQQLLTLADTDEEIRRLEHRRANLEAQQILDRHVETQESVMDELLEATRRRDRLQAEVTKLERDIEVVNTARKQKESSIYSGQITDEKQLEAVRAEVRDLERRKDDLEDSEIEAMEQLEDVTALADELTARRAELKDQIADLERLRDEAAADIDAELGTVRARREEEAGVVPDDVLAQYDSLRQAREGRRVVARLEGRTCRGCMLELTAIDLEEIKQEAQTGLARCPQCGSIIVP